MSSKPTCLFYQRVGLACRCLRYGVEDPSCGGALARCPYYHGPFRAVVTWPYRSVRAAYGAAGAAAVVVALQILHLVAR